VTAPNAAPANIQRAGYSACDGTPTIFRQPIRTNPVHLRPVKSFVDLAAPGWRKIHHLGPPEFTDGAFSISKRSRTEYRRGLADPLRGESSRWLRLSGRFAALAATGRRLPQLPDRQKFLTPRKCLRRTGFRARAREKFDDRSGKSDARPCSLEGSQGRAAMPLCGV